MDVGKLDPMSHTFTFCLSHMLSTIICSSEGNKPTTSVDVSKRQSFAEGSFLFYLVKSKIQNSNCKNITLKQLKTNYFAKMAALKGENFVMLSVSGFKLQPEVLYACGFHSWVCAECQINMVLFSIKRIKFQYKDNMDFFFFFLFPDDKPQKSCSNNCSVMNEELWD